jgi:hypothetical protein
VRRSTDVNPCGIQLNVEVGLDFWYYKLDEIQHVHGKVDQYMKASDTWQINQITVYLAIDH